MRRLFAEMQERGGAKRKEERANGLKNEQVAGWFDRDKSTKISTFSRISDQPRHLSNFYP